MLNAFANKTQKQQRNDLFINFTYFGVLKILYIKIITK